MNIDNPPAFPTRATGKSLGDGSWMADVIAGMTLRDYFAGQALASLHEWGLSDLGQKSAKACYAMADAMLAERAKQ